MRKALLGLGLGLICHYAAASQPVTLLALYDQLMANNATLKGREYLIEQFKAQKDQARSPLMPQISAIGNLSYNWSSQEETDPLTLQTRTIDSSYQGLRGVIQARQALFDLPSYRQFQGAENLVKQSEQELYATRMTVVADLVEAYLGALQAVDELSFVRSELELTASEAKRIHTMYERRLVKVTDVYDVDAYYQSLRTRELMVANAKAVFLEKLGELAGAPVEDIVSLAPKEFPPLPREATQWTKEADQNHPALAASQYAAQAAEDQIASARAERLPQLALQASGTYSDSGGFDNRQLDPYRITTVGLQLNIPIYSGGRIDASVREAMARHELAKTRWLEKLREIERQTRTAYLNAVAARARIDSSAREVEAREKARDASDRSYQLGVGTIRDFLEAKKNLLKARFEHAIARYDYINSLVSLRLWAGVLAQQDIEEINNWLASR